MYVFDGSVIIVTMWEGKTIFSNIKWFKIIILCVKLLLKDFPAKILYAGRVVFILAGKHIDRKTRMYYRSIVQQLGVSNAID